MSLPESYTLTMRESEFEEDTDIELRTPHEKITLATVHREEFAALFVAAPDLLAAMKELLKAHREGRRHEISYATGNARAAIAKAEGGAA